MSTLSERASEQQAEGIFLGGPPKLFEIAGRKLLITLLNEGLTPASTVLDIGCGCLRGGYWLIHFLDPGRYFGIEPNVQMLAAGIRVVLEPGLLDLKRPRFDHNAEFDFAVFQQKFDFFIARSIWSHASKQQIESMLDGFLRTSESHSVFLTSYYKATLFNKDYTGLEWVGRSHESNTPGIVYHRFRWIERACAKRKLVARELTNKICNFGDQTWILIKHAGT
jgi:hypothetical protein